MSHLFGRSTVRRGRLALVVVLVLFAVIPVALGMPNGPPAVDNNGDSVDVVGCTCHGVGYPSNGVPSDSVVVKIAGVPFAYSSGTIYQFTISVESVDAAGGGFLLKTFTASRFDWTEDQLVEPWEGTGEPAEQGFSMSAISQSDSASTEWVVTWTAPDTTTPIDFLLIGNAVNGVNGNDDGDHWNILNFQIDPDSSAAAGESGEQPLVRTLAVGDYEALFTSTEDPEAIEAAEQNANMEWIFVNGTIAYFATLAILLLGAMVQYEFYERRFGGGPPHLDMSLAVPQGIRRTIVTAILLYLAINGFVEGWSTWMNWTFLSFTIFAVYGIYRTIMMARAPASVDDVA